MNYMRRVLLTKKDCPKCEKLKEMLAERSILDSIPIVDGETAEGIAYISYAEQLKTARMPMLVDGEKAVIGVIAIIRYLSGESPPNGDKRC